MNTLTVADYEKLHPIASLDIDRHALKFHTPTQRVQSRIETFIGSRPLTIEWLLSLSSSSVLWDVGANVGAYSVLAAQACRARVVAFEASPLNCAVLLRNIELNGLEGRIQALCLGITDHGGIAPVRFTELREGAGAVFPSTDTPAENEGAIPGLLNLSSLDRVASEGGLAQPTDLRVAVSHHLFQVLDGARLLLSSRDLRSVLIDYRAADVDSARVDKVLAEFGFRAVKTHEVPVATGLGLFDIESVFARPSGSSALASHSTHLYTTGHQGFVSQLRTALEGKTFIGIDGWATCHLGRLAPPAFLDRLRPLMSALPVGTRSDREMTPSTHNEVPVDSSDRIFRALPEEAQELLFKAAAILASDEVAFLLMDKARGLMPGRLSHER